MGKLKAGMGLADFLVQATGRQLNRLGSKLGMDKDILEGMSENQNASLLFFLLSLIPKLQCGVIVSEWYF